MDLENLSNNIEQEISDSAKEEKSNRDKLSKDITKELHALNKLLKDNSKKELEKSKNNNKEINNINKMSYEEKKKAMNEKSSAVYNVNRIREDLDLGYNNSRNDNEKEEFRVLENEGRLLAENIQSDVISLEKSINDNYNFNNSKSKLTSNVYKRKFDLDGVIENENLSQAREFLDDDLAKYQQNPKVKSIKINLDDEYGGSINVTTNEALTDFEQQELNEYITGQLSDGIGEAFEQQEFSKNYPQEDDFEDYDEYLDNSDPEQVSIIYNNSNLREVEYKPIENTSDDELVNRYKKARTNEEINNRKHEDLLKTKDFNSDFEKYQYDKKNEDLKANASDLSSEINALEGELRKRGITKIAMTNGPFNNPSYKKSNHFNSKDDIKY